MGPRETGDSIRRLADQEVAGSEGWERVTDEPELLAVWATRAWGGPPGWQVSAAVAEFLREEPIFDRLEAAMVSELSLVPGVVAVSHRGRQVWIIDGAADGSALVEAAARAVDTVSELARPLVYP